MLKHIKVSELVTLIIKTNLATEYTAVQEVLYNYAQMIQKRTSVYKDNVLTPASKGEIKLIVQDNTVLKYFIQDLQKIKNVDVKCIN